MILRHKLLLSDKLDPARLSFKVLETEQSGQVDGICGIPNNFHQVSLG
jgi:hypothetical protein